jgi:hypothetical protein
MSAKATGQDISRRSNAGKGPEADFLETHKEATARAVSSISSGTAYC